MARHALARLLRHTAALGAAFALCHLPAELSALLNLFAFVFAAETMSGLKRAGRNYMRQNRDIRGNL